MQLDVAVEDVGSLGLEEDPAIAHVAVGCSLDAVDEKFDLTAVANGLQPAPF